MHNCSRYFLIMHNGGDFFHWIGGRQQWSLISIIQIYVPGDNMKKMGPQKRMISQGKSPQVYPEGKHSIVTEKEKTECQICFGLPPKHNGSIISTITMFFKTPLVTCPIISI